MSATSQLREGNAATDPVAAAPPFPVPAEAEPAITISDGAVRLGGETIWSGVNLEVRQGEFVAVLGANGTGKSTLMKAILGLVPLAAGSVSVLGRGPGHANHEVGYLPQRRTFDSATRVRGIDLVRLGLDGDRYGLPLSLTPAARTRRAEARRRVGEVIELVGATDYARRPIGELSGGEQQRLLIAQALVRRPQMLILDEPLDSLDLPNQAAIAALIQRVCATENVAVLLVAHDVNPLLSYLNRVIYLAGGHALQGSVDDVITTENLSRLYRTRVEVLKTSDGRLVVVGQPEAPHVHSDRHA